MSQHSIRSLKLKVDGQQAHYLKAGSGSPVVLLHGGASDCRDWTGVMANLAPGYSLYAPDLPGYGLSDKTKNGYYLSDFAEFIQGFIKALSLDSVVLVGHSFGGRLCLEIARCCPERIRKIVLIDTSGFGRTSRLSSTILTALWRLRKLARRPQPFPNFLIREGEDPHFIYDEQQLSGINIPTLIVWKRYDPYFPVSLAFEARKWLPQARLTVIPGYGHAPHKQNTDALCQHLKDFLDHA